MIRKNNLLVLYICFFLGLYGCKDRYIVRKTSNCDYSIYYQFIGLIDKDSLSQKLPKSLNVDFYYYNGVLTIKNCQGKADLVIFGDDGKVIGEGSYSEAIEIEKMEIGTMDLSFNIVVDTIKVYKTFLDGTSNFK